MWFDGIYFKQSSFYNLMDNYLLIAVDIGAMGGLALFQYGKPVKVYDMPETRKELFDFFSHQKELADEAQEKILVFVEKVAMFKSDKDEDGKIFGIVKMLANLEGVKTILEILEIPFVLTPAITWQTRLRLKWAEKLTKKERKSNYKDFASNYFPEIKITLKTADAACILIFAKRMLKHDPVWIRKNITTFEKNELF